MTTHPTTPAAHVPHATHEVINQSSALTDYNALEADPALVAALEREGGGWGMDRVRDFGGVVASAEAQEHSRRAQRNIPVLHTHDRFGHRIDEVEYDPSMHWMLRLGVEREVNSLPWRDPRPGAHVVRAGLFYLFNQLDTGPCCPMSINYAAVPTMRQDAALAAQWEPRLTLPDYDGFAQAGMVMTEKQGGSDLRANSTIAEPVGDGHYELTGHKWFCTHPIFDVFFTLAQTPAGITCFVAERPDPGFRLQRLKDKLGGRCLASSEVEYLRLPARILGEEGRGTAHMIEQIIWTRMDAVNGTAGMMRRLLAEAIWHTRQRSAFGAALADQPAMVNVLADLAVESEAAMTASLRIARAFDSDRPEEVAFRRFALAVMKYWVCKRGAPFAAEALECLGGNGYIEEAPMAQFYRDIQINTVWEGSGNVIALDVLRALRKEPEGLSALVGECELAAGADVRLDAHLQRVRDGLARLGGEQPQWHARAVVEDLALALQASLLVRHSPPMIADAFCASRLGGVGSHAFGTLPSGTAGSEIVQRALAL
ncbi:MAG TPA: acyl-CoA dehydrogenase family protein [Solirubrobacteraceae bacterium]|jgi:putative acyl-CoA dehydrogenase|nr:acyl-CoA dehydrogenase family protein [Solirubrobacteraceae bacterium]